MAVLRLTNGADLAVTLSVEEVMAALGGAADRDFVELPGDDGPIQLRPASVIAIVDEPRRQAAGFRLGSPSAAS